MTGQPLTRAEFPEAGDLRIWVVKHNPKSVATPVVLELREYLSPEAKRRAEARKTETGLTRHLGTVYTTAKRETLLAAADTLLERVGDIDLVVGVY